MQAMDERDAQYTLVGKVQVEDAYLGGERSGGKAGRGSENKVPFVAAVALNPTENRYTSKWTRSPTSPARQLPLGPEAASAQDAW